MVDFHGIIKGTVSSWASFLVAMISVASLDLWTHYLNKKRDSEESDYCCAK